jgi:hypothetical protein
MPVIFTTVEQFEIGLSGDVEEALKLQRPLPPEHLKIVAKDERIQGRAARAVRIAVHSARSSFDPSMAPFGDLESRNNRTGNPVYGSGA